MLNKTKRNETIETQKNSFLSLKIRVSAVQFCPKPPLLFIVKGYPLGSPFLICAAFFSWLFEKEKKEKRNEERYLFITAYLVNNYFKL